MDKRIQLIADALVELLSPESIIARNDSPSRVAESLELETKILYGTAPAPFDITADGITYNVDLSEGQKTGLYLDQLSNYPLVARHAKGRAVLDCFTNQGGFALACARAGASKVVAVDVSEAALKSAAVNAEKSNLTGIDWVEANVFDYLKQEHLAETK